MSEKELKKRLEATDLMLRKAISLIVMKPMDTRTEYDMEVMEDYIAHCDEWRKK